MKILVRVRHALAFAVVVLVAAATPPAAASQEAEAAAEAPAIEIPNGRTPSEGLLTGGQPTEEALAAAAAAGYRTIVNLRRADEPVPYDEPAAVAALGMDYVAIPIAGAADLTEANARELAAILADPERGPAMVHCASGNRVGALLAVKAFFVDAQDADAALEIGRQAGLTRLEPAVEEMLAGAAADPE